MRRKNVPCWCEITFSENPLGIAVLAHKEIIGPLKDREISWGFEEIFGFQTFSKLLGEEEFYGFDRAGIKKDRGEFIEIFFAIPQVDKMLDNPCPDCNGSGKDKFIDIPCSYCEGMGKEISRDWSSIFAVSASLSVLFRNPQMYSPDEEATSGLSQLITLNIMTSKEMGGSGIGGVWSKDFCDYLRYLYSHKAREEQVIQEVVEAMKKVYHHCFNTLNKSLFDDEFRVSIKENAWMVIDCPGDRCGVHPSHDPLSDGGCDFSCHNVDSPVQQITLLAGLAVLHDKAREDRGHY
jgi:hypothetical protein